MRCVPLEDYECRGNVFTAAHDYITGIVQCSVLAWVVDRGEGLIVGTTFDGGEKLMYSNAESTTWAVFRVYH